MKKSEFKKPNGLEWMKAWNHKVLETCGLRYSSLLVNTKYGKTHIWAKNHEDMEKPALVFLPGFRTCGLFWDLNNTLKPFYEDYRIYLIDIIGQAGLSDLKSPALKGNDFGYWLAEILDQLGLEKIVLLGASFGSFIMHKLAAVAQEKVALSVSFNPVGLQNINLGPRFIWYHALHLLFPSRKNIRKYLDEMVLSKDYTLQPGRRELIIEFQEYVVNGFRFGGDYPYKLSSQELKSFKVPAYYLLCKNDRLIDQLRTKERAIAILPNFKGARFFSGIGHGIEVSPEVHAELAVILKENRIG